VSIGLRVCGVEVADGLSSSSHCAVTPPDVMIPPISFAAIAAFSSIFPIPDTHFPLSKCCNCADGQLNRFSHSASAIHLISLSGLCRTDVRCRPSAPRFLKVLSHNLHFLCRLPSSCCFCFFFLFLLPPFPSPCTLL
jgi:hypothetical protein